MHLQTFPALAYLPVNGIFRAPRDAFQLWPAPPEAPRPPGLIGDHPFLFQYPVPDGSRGNRIRAEWLWFFNCVLIGHYRLPPVRARQMWVWRPEGGGVGWTSEGYLIPGYTYPSGPGFATFDGPPIREVPEREYYARRGITFGDEFTIPDSFRDDVERYLSLEPRRREQILRAGRWLAASYAHWDEHASSWFIALVAAIEALMPTAPTRDPCPACDRDRGPGPTARFREFIHHYASDLAEGPEATHLYAIRSALVHGGRMLELDAPPTFDPADIPIEELERLDQLSRIVRRVVVSWLRDPEAIQP